MNSPFFSTPSVRSLLMQYARLIQSLTPSDNFEAQRNELLTRIIDSFIEQPEFWDEKANFNIEVMGNAFLREMQDTTANREKINLTFTSFFRFCLELIMFSSDHASSFDTPKQIKDFCLSRYSEFDEASRSQIDYALREMPLNIVKKFIESHDVGNLKNLSRKTEEANKTLSKWDDYITQHEERIASIKDSLKNYESAFNFVGLYDGFNSLWKQKNNDLKKSGVVLFSLASIIPAPLILEMFFFNSKTDTANILSQAISLIPLASLTLIFIYYFRVALQHHSSLRTQILQLELRRSLCQFIQSYADYSKEVREGNVGALSKFEDIIFSNIMPSEEKIPSTFDGLEQIASLINSIRPK